MNDAALPPNDDLWKQEAVALWQTSRSAQRPQKRNTLPKGISTLAAIPSSSLPGLSTCIRPQAWVASVSSLHEPQGRSLQQREYTGLRL